MPNRYQKREGNGQFFLVTNSGFRQKIVYRSENDFQRFTNRIKLYAEMPETNVEVVAFILSSNEYHMVLRESVTGGIAKFLHKLSVSYAMYYNARYSHSGKLFAGPYKEQTLHDEESAVVMASRLHKRAVLMHQNPIEYAWSSLRFYIDDTDDWLSRKLFWDYFSSTAKTFQSDMTNFVDVAVP